jgi:hypothetical protein
VSILVNTGPTTHTFGWQVDGTNTDIGTCTIGIVDTDGNEVVASGTSVTDPGDGTYEYAVPIQTALKQLVLTWTIGAQSQQTYSDVVGGWLFTESELRAFYDSDLSTAATYSDAQLAVARDRITDAFEQHCGVSFVPRFRREIHSGDGGTVLQVHRPFLNSVSVATVGGVDVSSSVTVHPSFPWLYRTAGSWNGATQSDPLNVAVSYSHGHATVSGDIKRAALIAARQQLVKDVTGKGVPETASSWNDPTGQFVAFAANDQTDRWFGIPSVDSALRAASMKIPVW